MLCVGPRNNESNRSTTRRKSSLSSKKPLCQSVNLEESQHDAKSYRLAMHCFLNNLTKYYGKSHKDCLGDLQEWYKMPLTKQEQLSLQENISRVVQKNLDKLARDALARNFYIAKTVTEYSEEFYKYVGNPEGFTISTTTQMDVSKNCQKSTEKAQFQSANRPKSSCTLNRKRPQTTQLWNKNENNNKPQLRRFAQRGFVDLNSQFTGQGEDMSCFILVRQNLRKTFRYKNGIQPNMSFKNEQLYCRLKNKSELYVPSVDSMKTQSTQLRKQARYDMNLPKRPENQSNYRPHTAGDISKQLFSPIKCVNLQLRMSRAKKSRQEIQKQKIQNKILMLNSTLSTNAVTSQGYKPKTKCWGVSTDSGPKKLKVASNPPPAKYIFLNKNG